MQYEKPPFELGETLKGKDADGNLINSHWLGQVFEFPAIPTTGNIRGQKARKTGMAIKAVALRNESGIALVGKRIGTLTKTAGYSPVQSVDGYCDVLNETGCVVIDSNLPSAGVADDDIFWGIIEGPCTVLTGSAASAVNSIAVGDVLVAQTAVTSQSTTSGRVGKAAVANATDAQGAMEVGLGRIGKALSARTTNETNSDLLIQAAIRL